jgi:hypothetical protein
VKELTTIAVDLAKSVFEVAVSEVPGRVSQRKRLNRAGLALCANMSETAYPWDISEQGGEGIRDNHGRSRGVWSCQGSGR